MLFLGNQPRKLCTAAFVIFAIGTNTTFALEELQFRLADAGTANHNVHGQGIELQFEIRNLPDGAEKDPKLDFFFKELCRQFGPKVIPEVTKKTGLSQPEYIGIRLVTSSGIFKKFIFQAFQSDNNQCGEKL